LPTAPAAKSFPPVSVLSSLIGGFHDNEEWRICFNWNDGGIDNVEIVDYR
jgi:hypothetical protein